mmetsp:Transcript_24488/g.44395  ORF Transcript_24488/g.44395 Transcript_24488/m.44395 type:complete len:219 (-) Transcript_24488:22-678(-)
MSKSSNSVIRALNSTIRPFRRAISASLWASKPSSSLIRKTKDSFSFIKPAPPASCACKSRIWFCNLMMIVSFSFRTWPGTQSLRSSKRRRNSRMVVSRSRMMVSILLFSACQFLSSSSNFSRRARSSAMILSLSVIMRCKLSRSVVRVRILSMWTGQLGHLTFTVWFIGWPPEIETTSRRKNFPSRNSHCPSWVEALGTFFAPSAIARLRNSKKNRHS